MAVQDLRSRPTLAPSPQPQRQQSHPERNPGTPLELDWVREVRVNTSAAERRAATLPKRRTVKKDWQAAWYLRAITCIDLTTLQGDDTPGRVRRLCAKARQPVRRDILEALGVQHLGIRVAAVCVYHTMVATAVEALEGSGIPVAAVSAGFPAGLSPFAQRLAEIRESMAGADFIKTSTGKEKANATLPVSLIMVRAIRDYHERTGHFVGFKPAGGIATARQ